MTAQTKIDRRGKRPLRIAFGDLKHCTTGRHSVFMPIGIAYIASYSLGQIGKDKIDVRLYDDPDRMLEEIETWQPDVVAMANYCWNSQISDLVCRQAKAMDGDVICIKGGPDFPKDESECIAYLRERPEIDFYAFREGEVPFATFVQKLVEGADIEALRREPQLGMMALHPETGELLTGEEASRLMDMDQIPSPYLSGMLEPWFDGHSAPALETARGCPFKCSFCVQGAFNWSKVGHFSVDRIKAELTYIAGRMQHHPGILLGLFDSNFGMYKRDEEFAEHLRYLQDTYGWPNAFDVTTGKANYDRILRIAEQLQHRMDVSCSVQSWNDETLDIIQRKNLDFDEYKNVVQQVRRNGTTLAETIIPLPNETKETYLTGIKTIVDAGVEFLTAYTTMLLKGTELSSLDSRKRYGMKTGFRLLPRQFGSYRGEKCFEVEEVCVATNTLDFDDYLECRGFAFVATVFSSKQYDLCHRLLEEYGGDRYDWLQYIWQQTKSGGTFLSEAYDAFLEETRQELFPSIEALYEHFSQDEHYSRLLDGTLGDNLMRKYTTSVALDYCLPAFELAFSSLQVQVEKQSVQHDAIDAARNWALATRDLGSPFKNPNYLKKTDEIELAFDVNEWYRQSASSEPLTAFNRKAVYTLAIKDKDIGRFLAQQHDLYGDTFLVASKFFTNYSPKDLWRTCTPATGSTEPHTIH